MIFRNYMVNWNFSILFLSIILGMSSKSFFMFWVSLELNLISFLVILSQTEVRWNNLASMEYFVIQAIFSSMFFLMMILLYINGENLISYWGMMFSFLSKLGVAPMHVWFVNLSENLSMEIFFWLTSVQKILPLYGVKMMVCESLMIFILISVGVSLMNSFNQNLLLVMLIYSSIFNLGWILSSVMFFELALLNLLLYSFSLAGMIMFLSLNKYSNINVVSVMEIRLSSKIMMLVFMLNLSGLPPMLMFFMKILIIQFLLEMKESFLILVLMLSSIFMVYFYMRFILSGMVIKSGVNSSVNLMSMKVGIWLFFIVFPIWGMLWV